VGWFPVGFVIAEPFDQVFFATPGGARTSGPAHIQDRFDFVHVRVRLRLPTIFRKKCRIPVVVFVDVQGLCVSLLRQKPGFETSDMHPWMDLVSRALDSEFTSELVWLVFDEEWPMPEVCQLLGQTWINPSQVQPHEVTNFKALFELVREVVPSLSLSVGSASLSFGLEVLGPGPSVLVLPDLVSAPLICTSQPSRPGSPAQHGW
jgi:hypothetical protein